MSARRRASTRARWRRPPSTSRSAWPPTGRGAADLEARRRLGPRRSSVFPAPARAVLAAATYEEACALSRAACGKAISKQLFNILPKIREVDALVTRTASSDCSKCAPELSLAVAGRRADGPPQEHGRGSRRAGAGASARSSGAEAIARHAGAAPGGRPAPTTSSTPSPEPGRLARPGSTPRPGATVTSVGCDGSRGMSAARIARWRSPSSISTTRSTTGRAPSAAGRPPMSPGGLTRPARSPGCARWTIDGMTDRVEYPRPTR